MSNLKAVGNIWSMDIIRIAPLYAFWQMHTSVLRSKKNRAKYAGRDCDNRMSLWRRVSSGSDFKYAFQPGHQPICHFQSLPQKERGLRSYVDRNLHFSQLLMIDLLISWTSIFATGPVLIWFTSQRPSVLEDALCNQLSSFL